MEMKVLIWGIGKEFWQLYNVLTLNESVGNFVILGYVSKDRKEKYIGGKEVFLPEEIASNGIIFDYIVVVTEKYYKEIVDYGSKFLLINRSRFLNGKVFKIPYFDWRKYIELYNSNLSIITENCSGGLLSHLLGLPFNSPFVNVRIGIEKNDFFKIVENLDEYMQQSPLQEPKTKYYNYSWSGWEGRMDFPKLWYDDVMIHGFHYHSPKELFDIWEKRRKRYNPQNKFILKILYDQEDIERFLNIESENKIGFYCVGGGINQKHEKIIPIFVDNICDRYAYQFSSYVYYEWIGNGNMFKCIDVFSLFTGDKDWNKQK